MKPRLHVLIVDDSADDTDLLVLELTRGGYDVISLRVDTADALEQALAAGSWQVVLCDFSLPRFSGEAALRLVKGTGLNLPFIFVSGTIGEEVAVGAMKAGADDYVMKDRLARLVPVVSREVREAEERRLDTIRRRQLEDQLRQSQKMEAIGQLAGGVAHDFNNLLAVIQMASSLLLTRPSSLDEMRDGLQQILAVSERGANLTRQLLTFSRRSVRQAQDIDLAEVTGSMAKLLRRVLGADLALETRIAPALPLVHADPGMMEQILMNLAVNARDAMPSGGRLIVGLDAVDVTARDIEQRPHAIAGRFVRLRVQDTGNGIPVSDLPRIFEPFFTTKDVGKGTGLGLATVFGIVEQHHGWIDVASEVGRGTTFEIFVPALPGSGGASRPEHEGRTLARGTESILLVEDDAAVRRMARASLEHCGYRVHEAESPGRALALWEELPESIDLLFTDLVMPGGMTGCELAERLVERKPGLKVIYSSGYSYETVRPDLRLTPGYNFLQKPYHLAEMAATVRRCLDEPSSNR